MLDNTALDAIAQEQLGIEKPTVAEGNSLVSTVMAAATAPSRFPGECPPSPVGKLPGELGILARGLGPVMTAA